MQQIMRQSLWFWKTLDESGVDDSHGESQKIWVASVMFWVENKYIKMVEFTGFL